jgi:hypothetical protein
MCATRLAAAAALGLAAGVQPRQPKPPPEALQLKLLDVESVALAHTIQAVILIVRCGEVVCACIPQRSRHQTHGLALLLPQCHLHNELVALIAKSLDLRSTGKLSTQLLLGALHTYSA